MYRIKSKITQVVEGEHYSFEITINDLGSFAGNLRFGVHISELDNQTITSHEPKNMENFARRMFGFDLTSGGNSIEISMEIFAFLIQVIGKDSIGFYNNRQAQDSNDGLMGDLVNNGILSNLFGVKAEISIVGTFSTESIPDELVACLH